jgi:hypothetical protein
MGNAAPGYRSSVPALWLFTKQPTNCLHGASQLGRSSGFRDAEALVGLTTVLAATNIREDDSRIHCKPGIFARLRSFAANILRFNKVKNVSDARYRIAIGGPVALASLRLM